MHLADRIYDEDIRLTCVYTYILLPVVAMRKRNKNEMKCKYDAILIHAATIGSRGNGGVSNRFQ
jgi:hypothetical protein